MRAYQVTVTATAAELVAADDKNRYIYLNIIGNKTIAIGNASVTFATGLHLAKHTAPIEIFLPAKENIYAICDTNETDDVRVMTPNAD
jgi:hypothetical protein